MSAANDIGPAFIDGGQSAKRHRFFGALLRPFSLWHLFLLRAIASPFTAAGESALFDLQTAVGVCRLRYPDSRIVRPRLGPLALWRLCRKAGLRREVVRFLHYTGDALHKPEYGIHERPMPPGAKPAGQRGAPPELLCIAADIIGWTHWPEARVWDLPLGKAYWYRAMSQRALGADVDFRTESDRAFEAAMKAAGHQPKT